MTFDERLQRVSVLLHEYAENIERLTAEGESTMEDQYYVLLGMRLRAMAHGVGPDAPLEEVREQ
jgi:hypothetical protein